MAVKKYISGVVFIRAWEGGRGMLTYWCPGCKAGHTIEYGRDDAWSWDGNTEKPTLSPSILANGFRGNSSEEWNKAHPRCHAFVKQGIIEYLSDCEHKLAGQKVAMKPLPKKYSKFLED